MKLTLDLTEDNLKIYRQLTLDRCLLLMDKKKFDGTERQEEIVEKLTNIQVKISKILCDIVDGVDLLKEIETEYSKKKMICSLINTFLFIDNNIRSGV